MNSQACAGPHLLAELLFVQLLRYTHTMLVCLALFDLACR